MKKIMVTGARGYIGSKFIKKYKDKFIFEPLSLSAGDSPNFDGINTVLHLSALVHQTGELPDELYFKINTEQTESLAKKAKDAGVGHFVFFSTVAVYGKHGYLGEQSERIDEQSPCRPTDGYGKSKWEAEKILSALADDNFKVAIIRSPLVYGKDCPGNMYELKKLVARFPFLPFDYPHNRRSMIHVDNLLSFTQLVIEKQVAGILIPQDNDKYSIKQIVETLATGLNKKVCLFKFPGFLFAFLANKKPRLMSSLYGTLLFDSTASNAKTGYVEEVSTEKGLLLM
ncbi:MAG: NAD-dependent epimerase/dehydratase family protein [Candidatus Krumholzibacteriota bacterium]|nr:NAD-dependent epimerase/dehydratase family protein [Candidatus Krumholzibacteriota bacterium]